MKIISPNGQAMKLKQQGKNLGAVDGVDRKMVVGHAHIGWHWIL
jgi:hypothetical protein